MNDVFAPLWKAVEAELSCAAHDLSHVRRVYRMCFELYRLEGERADPIIMGAAAILHDIARVREDTDPQRKIDHALLGADMAYGLLLNLGWEKEKAALVADCVRTHRFRGGLAPESLEAKLLFDSDKLDCLGAIGIARSFMLAGQYGEPLYIHTDISRYERENLGANGRLQGFAVHAPNLEYEVKFRKIPQSLFTHAAKGIAAQRMALMERFFAELALVCGDDGNGA